jgi:alpha-galactosidase-like protein
MSTAFAILPASTTVPLDEAGHGSASFTVTNQTGRALRVRVSVTPAGNPLPPAGWLTPPENPERDLAADGALQFTVLVAVPSGSPGGTYNFRLDAVSVELPDEEWAHSPLVHFVVPEPPTEPEPIPEPVPDVRKGYVESLIGCLTGAFAAGLGVAVPLRILSLVVGSGDLRDKFDLVRIVAAPVAFWIGGTVGVIWYLRRKAFDGVYDTAVPTLLIFIPSAVIFGFLGIAAANALPSFPGKDILLPIVFGLPIAIPPPLIGRAIFRFRTLRHL